VNMSLSVYVAVGDLLRILFLHAVTISKHRLLFQEFWDWSWEELALFDLAEMIHHVHSVTSSKVFIVGHSQVLHVFLLHPSTSSFLSLLLCMRLLYLLVFRGPSCL
jgi:hypothetical protein